MEKLIFDMMWLYDLTFSEANDMLAFFGIEYMKKKVEEDKQDV